MPTERQRSIKCTVFAKFGIPETVGTDNGTPFVSEVFRDFLRRNGIEHVTSAPYHPASNGLAERAVQTVKQGLLKQVSGTIQIKLDRLLFAYRATLTESTGVYPAELMFGRTLRTRLNLLFPQPRSKIEARQTKLTERKRASDDLLLNESDTVYTRLPHEKLWKPATVISSSGNQNELQLEDGRIVRRHSDHVRPCSTPPENTKVPPFESETTETDTVVPHEDSNRQVVRRSTRTHKPVDRYQP
jgi:transposase InsO family protein